MPLGVTEPMLGYHPYVAEILTRRLTTSWTISGRRFDWGGRLLKCNGGMQRFPQPDRKPGAECKRIRELDCKRDISNRNESWR